MQLVRKSNFSEEQKCLYEDSDLFKRVKSHYYTTDSFCNYQAVYLGKNFEDLSFAVFDGKKPIIFVGVMSVDSHFDFFNFPLRIYESPDSSAAECLVAMGIVKKHLVSECRKREVSKLLYYENSYLNKLFQDQITATHLIKHFYIDLNLDDADIKNKIRKSYKSLVNWGIKNLKTVIMDRDNPDEELFESFRQFHIEVSGRETRSKESWDIQFEMVKSGDAQLVFCYLEEKLVSAAMSMCGSEVGYYGIAVNNREMMAERIPLGHWPVIALAWHSKKLGLKKFTMCEMNNTIYSNYIHDEEKWEQIELFKAGFANAMEFLNVVEVTIE